MIYRQLLAFLLSFALIFSATTQANAASSWSVSSAVSAGSRSIVTATKAGYKSAVNVAPTAGRLALKLGKGANWAALLYAAVQLAPDLADIKSFQPDYANDRVVYDKPEVITYNWSFSNKTWRAKSAEEACDLVGMPAGHKFVRVQYAADGASASCVTFYNYREWDNNKVTRNALVSKGVGYIPIPAAAAQVIKNADAGHADSRAATRETATEMVIGGQFDQDLLNGAVPTNDTRPLVPSVPISGNGNVTAGSGIGVGTGDDGLMTGGDLGKAADDAIAAADDARKAAEAAKDAATAAANDARVAAEKANDLINSAVDQAIKDAAKATADAAAQAAKDAAAVSDAAVKAANDIAAAAERAAEAAASAAKDAAAQAAKDLDDAKAAGDAAAIAAAQAAKAAADAALADAKAKQEAAEKAAEKAKAEAAKPFELPAFCSWASVVCEFIDWSKQKADEVKEYFKKPDDEVPLDIPDPSLPSIDSDISFGGSCPADLGADFNLYGTNFTFVLMPFSKMCPLLSTFVKPTLILLGSFMAVTIVGGRKET